MNLVCADKLTMKIRHTYTFQNCNHLTANCCISVSGALSGSRYYLAQNATQLECSKHKFVSRISNFIAGGASLREYTYIYVHLSAYISSQNQ